MSVPDLTQLAVMILDTKTFVSFKVQEIKPLDVYSLFVSNAPCMSSSKRTVTPAKLNPPLPGQEHIDQYPVWRARLPPQLPYGDLPSPFEPIYIYPLGQHPMLLG